ncbi:4-hydroxyphenylpyruvate dioxygenase [Rhodothalassium salexigens DSM 2132]|uniref:4-hydroxyphenylpyruvate dioxygenase n=1 Tax=Rhodothalassium salexigens DSM 2132 TaxID=1188247 RepID=A0A4R2PSA3_RHOSA|nr:4-hydroxyphenylpyruvate dioxygenase [Rhodothalassium salexigens]MBB4210615.1 4-hydroxyphenylpyruvate dioxygenase [Rhodothalassium salexigens DSM 2132]MBK1639071.1 4-hydroxyphenylpyruvate dioxygenase [Rhodothalassium salexigens DSM 2132]TCP37828.1 4-hydroxyphenylpyruvate dioxygenase [Rhodothalassium salexigens DSM 2132]
MADLHDNPLGTDGFDFVEYAAPDPQMLRALFDRLGFPAVARHPARDITLHRQGDVVFLVNAEPTGFAAAFARAHGPCACAMGFRVRDAEFAYKGALERGAEPAPVVGDDTVVDAPVIGGIGGSRIYLVDRYGDFGTVFDAYQPLPGAADAMAAQGAGLTYLDHLTHNVQRGNMDTWAGFYERVFNFREIRYFDIEGKQTGLFSRAMTAPCGKIRIPINESQDDKSQIAEYLKEYKGEGIQHIALGTDDIYATVDKLRANGVAFQETPATYYEQVDARVPGHGEPLDALRRRSILVDGAPTEGQGLLLQIFTQTVIGPIFFEIIQRKGNDGFGEGNFKALFESIELDQIRRGVLDAEDATSAAE